MTRHESKAFADTVVDADRPLVDVRNLRVRFGDRVSVVSGLDLTIRRGEVVAIVGESGSGKSVTARSLVGLAGRGAKVTAERFHIAETDGLTLTERQWQRIRGRRIGLVLQDALTSLDPLRAIGAEVAEALTTADPTRRSRAEIVSEVETLLRSAGITEPEIKRQQYPHQLSGGQRQRALIASALAGNPDLVIADEPTTALDVTVQARVLAMLAERTGAGRGLLLISHDLAVVARMAHRIIVMHRGQVVEQGTVEQVIGDPKDAYTRALIAAIPGKQSRGRRLSALPPIAARPSETERPATHGPVVRVDAIGKHYRTRGADKPLPAVNNVSFTINPGEILGLVGESGSGKSTVARIVTGLLLPDEGRVAIHGAAWPGTTQIERKAQLGQVHLVGQDSLGSFDPRYTVREIVAESVALRIPDPQQREKRVSELLDLVQLPSGTIDRHPRGLSGGQRQRVSIARAIGGEPSVLICDEPVSALDVSVQAQILDLLGDIRRELGTAMLFISHDIGVIQHLSDRVLVMFAGRIVESGPTETVLSHPAEPYTQALLQALPRL